MSSWKKYAPNKEHRERSQPYKRRKFGLLEKHKDYVQRARDYHRKQDTIHALQEKAFSKNPDEFYFSMKKSRVVDGVHQTVEKDVVDHEDLQHLKEQDRVYLSFKNKIEKAKIDRLQSNLHFIGETPRNQQTFFVESVDDLKRFDLSERLSTSAELLERTFNRPRKDQLESKSNQTLASLITNNVSGSDESPNPQYQELAARVSRDVKLSRLLGKMQAHRAAQSKGTKKKVMSLKGGVPSYKFKKERKR
eukprot:ANDGO_08784.mRNA.1 hypothetical protein